LAALWLAIIIFKIKKSKKIVWKTYWESGLQCNIKEKIPNNNLLGMAIK